MIAKKMLGALVLTVAFLAQVPAQAETSFAFKPDSPACKRAIARKATGEALICACDYRFPSQPKVKLCGQ
jgi:hypothetical protein